MNKTIVLYVPLSWFNIHICGKARKLQVAELLQDEHALGGPWQEFGISTSTHLPLQSCALLVSYRRNHLALVRPFPIEFSDLGRNNLPLFVFDVP